MMFLGCYENSLKFTYFIYLLSSSLMEFLPREKDGIVYNFNFITKGFDEKKFLMNKPGKIVGRGFGTNGLKQMVRVVNQAIEIAQKKESSRIC